MIMLIFFDDLDVEESLENAKNGQKQERAVREIPNQEQHERKPVNQSCNVFFKKK